MELAGLISMTLDSQIRHNILQTQWAPQVPTWVIKGEAETSEAHISQHRLSWVATLLKEVL